MLGRILPRKWSPSSTKSSAHYAPILLAVWMLPGCRHETIARAGLAPGYVDIAKLVREHPGWQEVLSLDKMMAQSSQPVFRRAQPLLGLPAIRPSSPLVEKNAFRDRAAGREKDLIARVTEAAHDRIGKLQNTLRRRTERAVEREQRRGAALVAQDIQTEEVRLREIERRAVAGSVRVEHVNLRDLHLKEIALQSRFDAYAPFPGTIRDETAQKLKQTRDDIAGIEARLSEIEQREAQKRDQALIDFKKQRTADEVKRMDEFRKSREQEIARTVSESQQIVDFELGTLSPLQVPDRTNAAPVPELTLPPPSAFASNPASTPARRPAEALSSIGALKEQRRRLIDFLRSDVERRVARIATERKWRIVFSKSQESGPDRTREVAEILRTEWTLTAGL